MSRITTNQTNSNSQDQTLFENLKHIDENQLEFWYARELQIVLGYKRWEDFYKLVEKTKNLDFEMKSDHIRLVPKKVILGSMAEREIDDFELSREFCYKVSMQGRTKQCILARTYFYIQTIKQERSEQLSKDQRRVEIRDQITEENKKLFDTAKESGVNNFAEFNDQGYIGLYGMRNSQIIKKKKLGDDRILDRSGATELAANLFRITQTDEKLRTDNVNSQSQSEKIHNMVGGKIRQTIKDIGGTLPEELQPEKYIKEIKKEIKKLTSTPKPKTLK